MKLSKRIVDGLIFDGKQKDYFDESLRGFGIRISADAKTFFCRSLVAGKRTRVTIGRFGIFSCEQARQRAVELLAELQKGHDLNAQKREQKNKQMTLGEVLEKYFIARHKLKPRTVDTYRQLFRLYLSDWMNLPINEISKDMVANRHLEISRDHGPAPADNCMRTLRAIYNFGNEILDDSLGVNPVKRLSNIRQWNNVQRKTRTIPPDQLPSFFVALNELKNPTARDYIMMLLFTGARRLEMAMLQWDHVNMDAKTFSLMTTKNGRPLHLPMSEPVFEIFQRRQEFRENDFVFPGWGRTGRLFSIKRNIAKIEEKTGIKFSEHDLRRTFAGIAAQVLTAYELKRLLNHAIQQGDPTDGYVTQNAERLRPAAEKVAAQILLFVESPREQKNNVVQFRKVI